MSHARKLMLGIAAGLLAVNTFAAGEDCERPEAPTVPDGSTATESELLTAQQDVKGYVMEGQKYMECLKKAEADLGEDITEEQSKELVNHYNTMVDEMQATSDRFNAAVRAYKTSSTE